MSNPAPQAAGDFAYFDGAQTVHADALALYRQILIRTRGKPNELPDKVFSCRPDEQDVTKLMESWAAAEELVQLVRDVFQMQLHDRATGTGAREEHCWAVWAQFCDHLAQEKKTRGSPPTSSSPTAPAPGTASETAAAPASSGSR
jgi:hypothetical protein